MPLTRLGVGLAAIGMLASGGCYASHETDAADAAEAGLSIPWSRPAWPGPGPAPNPCDTFPPAFFPVPFLEDWFPAAAPDDPWVFDSWRGRCYSWSLPACPLPDCGPEHQDSGEGSAFFGCIIQPNSPGERQYEAYRESAASGWCFFASREQCECECLSRCR